MQIAIDASRTTVARLTGTEHYALRLIQALIEQNHNRPDPFSIDLYFRDSPPTTLFPESEFVTHKIIPFPRMWTHLKFAQSLWQDRPNITFVPAHTLPFVFPGKSIVTVHDLGYKYFPDAHPTKQRLYLDMTTRYSQARASLIFADSRATAEDLTRFYGTVPEKIRVIYPGVDAEPLTSQVHRVAEVTQKYALPDRYFLFIGTLQPRKNIARIVQAFAQWRARYDNQDMGLVLAGGKGWLFDEAWINGAENVFLTGYIDEADKGALMAGAVALVFPTLYEGFGFPVLEAMLCGTPVIASRTSSLPELVGEAGLLVDPSEVSEIADAMGQISENASLRESLVTAGTKQASAFTWDETAKNVLIAFDDLRTMP